LFGLLWIFGFGLDWFLIWIALLDLFAFCDSSFFLVMEPARKRKSSPVWEFFEMVAHNKVYVLLLL